MASEFYSDDDKYNLTWTKSNTLRYVFVVLIKFTESLTNKFTAR